MNLVKIEAAWINPDLVAAVLPDSGQFYEGVQIVPGNPERSVILLASGKSVGVSGRPDVIRAKLETDPSRESPRN